MIPSIISHPPSLASPSSPDRTESPSPSVAATSQATAVASSTTASARPAMSRAATAAKLRALSPLSVPERQGGHKRFPSRDAGELAAECGRISQAPRSACLESPPGLFPEKPVGLPVLRHAASTSVLQEKSLKARGWNALTADDAGALAKAGSDRQTLAAQYEQTDFWKNGERAGLIRMKRENAGTGAADAVYRMAAAALIKFPELQYNKNTKFHSTLIRQPGGACLLEDARTRNTAPPVDGRKYIFVTMPDSTVRVCPQASGGNGHAQVSGYAPYVKYAGEVIFEKGKEVSATRQSGTYLPPPENARELSGLNCEFIDDFQAFGRESTGQAAAAHAGRLD
ncbi:hypothetical protein [Noviherbaspirillum malthae]|uniref:hypothetical protein n=1 Tax=Noviherbaspirillum malthae TaxID=1260987 RepID=UPI00188F381A|nr:hypothetical protein [Noviherbaspirillum malthae]